MESVPPARTENAVVSKKEIGDAIAKEGETEFARVGVRKKANFFWKTIKMKVNMDFNSNPRIPYGDHSRTLKEIKLGQLKKVSPDTGSHELIYYYFKN